MIAVSGLAKWFGAQSLFEGVAFQLNPGCRYGLVGANGSGKTTLLRILAGQEEPSAGAVARPRRLRLGTLEQDHYRFEALPILEVAMMGHHELWQAIRDKEALLERADTHFDGDGYAELEDVIASHDGYAFEARSAEILEGLGIPTAIHRDPLSTLSGGFKLRVLLAQALAADPQCLLLDEPTNHLDILSIRWLEKFLAGFAGCALVISHDHRFLDNISTHILDIDYQTVTVYTGNYSAFVEAKQAERDRREAEIAKREREIAQHQAFVDRFRAKNTKARQAQSKIKQIERISIESLPPSSRRYPSFRFRQRRPSGKQVLSFEGVSKAFGDNRVLCDVTLHIRRGDRVAIIGPNGIGKSTLLKVGMGQLEADAGTVTWGHETHPGYFAQDHRERLEGSNATVEAWLGEACVGESIGFVRGQLGKVLFSRDEVEKKVASLSGGEAARLLFARLSVEQPNVLVLDEPTNHLDLEAIEALVEALADFDGTLIFVSHDRWFVSLLATRIVEITERGMNDYHGSYDDYLAACGDDHLDSDQVVLRQRRTRARSAERRPPPKSADQRAAERRRRDLELRRDLATATIEEAERRIEAIDARFCEGGFFEETPAAAVRALQEEQQGLRDKVRELMAEWEGIERELEGLSAQAE
jgi:ATPase subunit of ABC transporter with duplicated ATPase domains